MSEIVKETESTIGSVPASGSEASWLAPVPLKYRKMRAWLVLGAGIVFSIALAWMQFLNSKPIEDFWLSVIPFAIGLVRWRVWLTRENVRKYASTTKLLSKKERLNNTSWSILGFLVGAYLILLDYAMGGNMALMVLGAVVLICSIAVGLVRYLRKEESVITKEGAAAKARLEMDTWGDKLLSRFVEILFTTLEHPWAQYSFAGLLLYVAYRAYLDPEPGSGLWAIIYAVAALYVARKVFAIIAVLSVFGLIGWAIFGAVAALPVSVAIIIGAIIIAGAANSK